MTTRIKRYTRILLIAVAVVAVVLLLWKVPQWQAAGIRPTAADPNVRLTFENELRRTIATILAGLFVLVSGILAWLNIQVAREGQITDRFTKAIEQLGATHPDGRNHLELRLGGIYALERIAQDSPARDDGPVMEVLTAYVRQQVPVDPELPPITLIPRRWRSTPPSVPHSASRPPPTDVQAVLRVLGRRTNTQRQRGHRSLDLSYTNLRSMSLEHRAHLEGVRLVGAHLEEAWLWGVHLEGADLWGAHLEGAILRGVSLEGATMWWTHLEGASMEGASMEGAVLTGAILRETHLEGAVLRGVIGLTQETIDDTYMDDSTLLPDDPGPDGQPFRRSTRTPPSVEE